MGVGATIARLVGDDAKQPGAKSRALAKALPGTMRLDEGVLRAPRVGRRARDEPGDPEGDCLMLLDDPLTGRLVAALCPRDEVRFAQWPVLHCASCTALGARRFPTCRMGTFEAVGR